MPDRITSVSNARIRRLVELRKKARARREARSFVIEGTRLCMDTPLQFIEEVYVTDEWISGVPAGDREHFAQVPVTVVTEEVMAKASDTGTPQGILCVAEMPAYSREDLLGAGITQKGFSGAPGPEDAKDQRVRQSLTDEAAAPLLLLLEDLQDPGNLGTIFRTAEAAGATGILMSRETVDLFNPKVVRATMSAIFRMPFLICDDLAEEVPRLRGRGIRTYAAHLGGRRSYDALPLTEGTAFLIGNEGNGLSDRLTEAADEKIIIPMLGGAESLNAAMAAGILVFEAARQRRAGHDLA